MASTICAYCSEPSEFILLSSEDGSNIAFCSWECTIRFLSSRIIEPISYPVSEIINGRCSICGKDAGGEELCDSCLDDQFVLMKAIMKARTIDDIAVAWITWRNGFPRKPGQKGFMDNCRQCGKVIWIKDWERKYDSNLAQFCSKGCADIAKS